MLIGNGYAAAEQAALEVLVVVVGIPQILPQEKRGLSMNYLTNSLYCDMRVILYHQFEEDSKMMLENSASVMAVGAGPGVYLDFALLQRAHSSPVPNLL